MIFFFFFFFFGKESACNARDPVSVPGLGRLPGEENGYLLQQSCMENLVDRRVWSLDCGQWDHKESDMTE